MTVPDAKVTFWLNWYVPVWPLPTVDAVPVVVNWEPIYTLEDAPRVPPVTVVEDERRTMPGPIGKFPFAVTVRIPFEAEAVIEA